MSLIKEFKAFASRQCDRHGRWYHHRCRIRQDSPSFVADIIMPPIGIILGGVNFSDLSIVLQAAQGDAPSVVIAYGKIHSNHYRLYDYRLRYFYGRQSNQSLKAQRRSRA